MEQCRTQYILKALREVGWNRTKAAKVLGISARTMFNFVSEHPDDVPELTREDRQAVARRAAQAAAARRRERAW